MTYEKFISAISDDVARILKENYLNIAENLLSGLPGKPCISQEQLQLCRNAVTISTQLSVQIIFDYLDSLEILNYQNLSEHFERPDLKVIHGSLSDSPKK